MGPYEITNGENIDARTGRVGVQFAPWSGARAATAVGQQDITKYAKRSFAAFGLMQWVPVTKNLTLDATLDANRALGGIDPAKLINPQHPAASGGKIGDNGTLTENFTALTLAALGMPASGAPPGAANGAMGSMPTAA